MAASTASATAVSNRSPHSHTPTRCRCPCGTLTLTHSLAKKAASTGVAAARVAATRTRNHTVCESGHPGWSPVWPSLWHSGYSAPEATRSSQHRASSSGGIATPAHPNTQCYHSDSVHVTTIDITIEFFLGRGLQCVACVPPVLLVQVVVGHTGTLTQPAGMRPRDHGHGPCLDLATSRWRSRGLSATRASDPALSCDHSTAHAFFPAPLFLNASAAACFPPPVPGCSAQANNKHRPYRMLHWIGHCARTLQ